MMAANARNSSRIVRMARDMERARAQAYERSAPESDPQRVVKVVAEGDSWFSYFPPNDILASLRNRRWNGWDYQVSDRAKAGALLNDMVYGRDMVDTYQLLEDESPDVFLFSGGGNDIAGPELFVMLYHRKAVEMTAGLPSINAKILQGLVDEVFLRSYLDLVALIRHKARAIGRPDLPIILHGYDYAIPDGRGWGGGWGPLPGPWLDPSLTSKGYDRVRHEAVRRRIVRQLIDAVNATLAKVAQSDRNVHHVDLRGTLADGEWANELHPTPEGFAAVTGKIEARIRAVLSAAKPERAPRRRKRRRT